MKNFKILIGAIVVIGILFIGYNYLTSEKKRKKIKETGTTLIVALDFQKNKIALTKAIRIEKDSCYYNEDDKKVCVIDTTYAMPVDKYDSVIKRDTTLWYKLNNNAVIMDLNATIKPQLNGAVTN